MLVRCVLLCGLMSFEGGRWTALRVRKRALPLKVFQQLFNGQPLSSDFLVTAITMLV